MGLFHRYVAEERNRKREAEKGNGLERAKEGTSYIIGRCTTSKCGYTGLCERAVDASRLPDITEFYDSIRCVIDIVDMLLELQRAIYIARCQTAVKPKRRPGRNRTVLLRAKHRALHVFAFGFGGMPTYNPRRLMYSEIAVVQIDLERDCIFNATRPSSSLCAVLRRQVELWSPCVLNMCWW